MKKLLILTLSGVLIATTSAQSLVPLPPQWKAWSNGGSYNIGEDTSSYPFGLTIKQKTKPKGNKIGKGGFCQTIKADNYIGKRVEYSAYIKVKNVTNWAYIFARYGEAYPFKGIKGNAENPVTQDWTKVSMVFDLPKQESADNIRLCFSLWGDGQMWIDGIKWEVVAPENIVPTNVQSAIPLEPIL